jgi:malonyl CoA-acyl carrier protein transacylase
VESVQAAAALVPDARWIEIGPGSVLAGLVRKIVPGVVVTSLGTADDLEKFLAA